MLTGINSAVSALLGLSKKSGVTANNVANSNTPGFKSSRLNLSTSGIQETATANGSGQIGRGVTTGSISTNFSQGGIAPSENPTELAVSGNGYFILREPTSSKADLYSRDGNFSFNKEGFLTTPSGQYVQGWAIENDTRAGTPGDIQLGATSPPVPTTSITQILNLDARTPAEEINETLFDAWDGRNVTNHPPTAPIKINNFTCSSSSAIYDSQGAKRDITIYYDRTTNSNEYEFLVTTDPTTDRRITDNTSITATGDKGSGALMYGTLTFGSNGEIESIKAYNIPADGQVNPESPDNRIHLSPADSTYSFPVNFTGDTENQQIQLDFGAVYSGTDDNFRPAAQATTQYANTSATITTSQDGSGSGFLQSVHTDTNGIISASYSNGQVIKKGQVALASFSSPENLNQQGGNIFKATSRSGSAVTGAPGEAGNGTIIPNGTELSNVDLAVEIPSMLLTRRFFQANIKMIQAGDEMLGSLLDIKT
jgi:flagellar hook protein FlgE